MQANTISRPAGQLDVALRLAAVGLPVFPVNPKTGVSPITEWPDLATTDPDQIKAWWRQHRRAAVGLVTGERSGIAVLDLDRKNGKPRWRGRPFAPVFVIWRRTTLGCRRPWRTGWARWLERGSSRPATPLP